MGRLWKLCTVPAGVACPQAGDSSSVLDLRYGYDEVGNILDLRDRTGGGDQLQSFTYDALDRLTDATGIYSAGYNYDPIGNLLSKDEAGVGHTLAYTNAQHVHAPSVVDGAVYTYDENGNLLDRPGDTLTYDAENRLQSVTSGGETVTFTYDGDGRRVIRDTTTETTAYVGPHYEARFTKTDKPEDLDGDCRVTVIDIMRVAAQWGAQGPSIPEDVNDDQIVDIADVQQVAGLWRETCHQLAETVKYYSLGGQRVAMRKDGTLYYLFTDHLNSTSVTYNTATGQTQTLRYYPWGGVRAGDIPTDRRFTGQRWDATIGLYDYNARWYDQTLGRFIQPDTMVSEPGKPQALNRYSYVYNNPLRYIDPSGHFSEDQLREWFGNQQVEQWMQDENWWSTLLAAEFGDWILTASLRPVAGGRGQFVSGDQGQAVLSNVRMLRDWQLQSRDQVPLGEWYELFPNADYLLGEAGSAAQVATGLSVVATGVDVGALYVQGMGILAFPIPVVGPPAYVLASAAASGLSFTSFLTVSAADVLGGHTGIDFQGGEVYVGQDTLVSGTLLATGRYTRIPPPWALTLDAGAVVYDVARLTGVWPDTEAFELHITSKGVHVEPY